MLEYRADDTEDGAQSRILHGDVTRNLSALLQSPPYYPGSRQSTSCMMLQMLSENPWVICRHNFIVEYIVQKTSHFLLLSSLVKNSPVNASAKKPFQADKVTFIDLHKNRFVNIQIIISYSCIFS